MGGTRFLLILDAFLFVAAVALQAVRFTGLTAHEWLGIIIAVPLVVHLILQWQWIRSTWRRAVEQRNRRAQFNFLLNTLLFVAMTLAIYSGIMASEILTPHIALAAGRKSFWSDFHSFTTNTLVALVGLHVALNWRWIVSAFRLHVTRRFSAATVPARALTTDPEDAE